MKGARAWARYLAVQEAENRRKRLAGGFDRAWDVYGVRFQALTRGCDRARALACAALTAEAGAVQS